MKDSYHSVRPVFNDGWVKFEFKCLAPPDAPCRTRSTTFQDVDWRVFTFEDIGKKAQGRITSTGLLCKFVEWMDIDPGAAIEVGPAEGIVREGLIEYKWNGLMEQYEWWYANEYD